MAIEVNLRDIQSGFLTATAFTQNNTLIEEAFSKAINREGGSGNSMQADLDMGLNNIINADNLDVNSITIDGTDYEAVVEAHRIAAANSAAAALASEQAAYGSEQAAALSAQNAASSEQNAAADEQATAQYLAQFSTQYLGSHPEAPLTDDYGDPIQAGAMYWDTTVSKMYIYTGTVWGTTEQAFLDALQYTFDQDQIARSNAFDQSQQDRSDTFDLSEQSREDTFVLSQQDKEDRFNTFIASSGYTFLGAYTASITVNDYNEVVQDVNGEFWRVSGTTTLPYTTDGTGLPEGGVFVAVGDAVLRQELAANNGTTLIGYGAGTLDDKLTDLSGDLTDHINATSSHAASSITYDNTATGFTATDVQAAVDEMQTTVDGVYTYIENNKAPEVYWVSDQYYVSTGDGASASFTFPANVADGDILICFLRADTDVTAPAGWAKIVDDFDIELPARRNLVFTKTATVSDASSTVTFTGTAAELKGGIAVAVTHSSPISVGTPVVTKEMFDYSDGRYKTPAIKATVPNSLAITTAAIGYGYDDGGLVIPGWTLLTDCNPGSSLDSRTGFAYKQAAEKEFVQAYWTNPRGHSYSGADGGVFSVFLIEPGA